MNKWTKWICLLLVAVMMLSLFGCGKKRGGKGAKPVDIEPYIGTWQASDHDGEKVIHYVVFDSDGYWHVYMNYNTLKRAIQQLPDQLVSFKIFRELQNSDHTGCYYEYVVDSDYTSEFYMGDDGRLRSTGAEELIYVKLYPDSGEPNDVVFSEARDLFDRAREDALSK